MSDCNKCLGKVREQAKRIKNDIVVGELGGTVG